MHEYSIVQSLLNNCEENAGQNGSTKVTKVVVKIGVLSGVEPDLLQIAFDTFKENTICHDALFVINIQKVVIKCKTCGSTSKLEKHHYCCPLCESIDIDILDGEDMYLMQLELQ
jgi:hydrogenase nickel incorporation protein HypA/HybF